MDVGTKKEKRLLTTLAKDYQVHYSQLVDLVRNEDMAPIEAVRFLKAGGVPKRIQPNVKNKKQQIPPDVKRSRKEQNNFLKLMADEMGLYFHDLHRLVRFEGLTPGQAAARLMIQ